MVDMHHHRHVDAFGDLPGDVQRDKAGIARRVKADANFDAGQRISVCLRHLDGVEGRHEPEVAALSHHHALGKAVDARERHVEIGDDAHRRRA